MHRVLPGLIVVGILTTFGIQTGFAQQRQLPPVTITYRSTSVVRTQWSPDSANPGFASGNGIMPNASSMNGASDTGTRSPGLLPGANGQPNQFSPGFSSGAAAGGTFTFVNERPNIQQLQNASGAFNMTHTSFTQSPYASPNNYFGPQFNTWSNLSTQPANLAAFESFNRIQPDTNSGAYYSPNTYIGPMNNQWSSLSSGTVSMNDMGAWSYWP